MENKLSMANWLVHKIKRERHYNHFPPPTERKVFKDIGVDNRKGGILQSHFLSSELVTKYRELTPMQPRTHATQ